MSKKSHVELLHESQMPEALIVSETSLSRLLKDRLTKQGLKVRLIPEFSPSLGDSLEPVYKKYDYIFHLSHISHIDYLGRNHLKKEGKLLYLETKDLSVDTLKSLVNKSQFAKEIRIVKAYNSQLFDSHFLVEKILTIMFEKDQKTVVEINPPVKKSEAEKTAYLPKEETMFLDHSINKPHKKPKKKEAFREVRFDKKRMAILTAVISPFVLLILVFSLFIFSFKATFESIRRNFASSNISGLQKDLKQAKDQISYAGKAYDIVYTVVFPLRFINSVREIGNLIHALDDVISSGYELSNSYKSFFNPSSTFFASASPLERSDLQGLTEKLRNLQETLSLARQRMDRIDLPYFPQGEYVAFLDNWEKQLDDGQEIAQLIDQFLYSDTAKIYLLLFQNNMEIRPTGGFIGSIGLLTLGEGKIHDFKIYDVYTADGQLKGHVDPPEPIRKYLSQQHYFLRDSNFDPDFTLASYQASFFLEKELGINVDGVIGINLFLLQDLLEVLGPVVLTDFNNETIDADNLFFKMQLFSQRDFFPGSLEKRDFLTSLFNQIKGKFNASSKLPWFKLLSIVKRSLDEKNILLYSVDSQFQEIIEDSAWGGRLVSVECVGDFDNNSLCFADYLSIVEANLGVNKANYFITKQVEVNKDIKPDGEIETIVTINYQNKAQPEIFPNSIYSNYLRIFVPPGSKLKNVFIDENRLTESQVDFDRHLSGKTSFGFLAKVFPQSNKVIKIIYYLPTKLTPEADYYQFFFQKQAGDKTWPLTLFIASKEQFALNPINFENQSKEKEDMLLTTDSSVDRIFAFKKITP